MNLWTSCFNTWCLPSAKPKWICSPGNIYGVISLVVQQLSHKIFTMVCFKILHLNLAFGSGRGHVIAAVWWNNTVDGKSCTRWQVVYPTICNTSKVVQDLSMLANSGKPLQMSDPHEKVLRVNMWISTGGFWCAVFRLNLLSWYRLYANMRVHNE